MFFFENGKIILRATAPEVDVEYIRSVTGFDFEVSDDLKVMEA
jgi:acyl CoA:acetate/3-ketoacid CoA transferase beta subunit